MLWGIRAAVLAAFLCLSGAAGAAEPSPAAWPKTFGDGQTRVEVYQPQIDRWEGNSLGGSAAFAYGQEKGQPSYGIVKFTARVDVDKEARVAVLRDITLDAVSLPTAPADAAGVKQTLEAALPVKMTVSLDQLQTTAEVSKAIAADLTVPVKNDPPKIIVSTVPALLVPVDGEPRLAALPGTEFERVINTRALVLRDAGGVFHLRAVDLWFAAPALGGPWLRETASAALDAAVKAAAGAPGDLLATKDGKPPAIVPVIHVETVPTELVELDGQAKIVPVAGTELLEVRNADTPLFIDPGSGRYYLLISGRWFASGSLDGPWAFVPSDSLPAAFAKIPADDPRGAVLASVAGTPQAQEAVIAASVPQTATIDRNKAKAEVSYDGTARFVPIEGTSLRYAVNSPVPVIEVDSRHYYAVVNGVWFTAPAPQGPWVVAESVPQVIYTIPSSSPLHYVTYVRIYEATPETIVTGYTPGYMGAVVAPGGTVVYGTGYSYPAYVNENVWYEPPATYGYGAGVGVGALVGFAFGLAASSDWDDPVIEPYWGPYYWHDPIQNDWSHVDIDTTNVYNRWGGGTAVVTHDFGWSEDDHTSWNSRQVSAYNPWTGRSVTAQGGVERDWKHDTYQAGREVETSNAVTGVNSERRAGITGDVDDGSFTAGREGKVTGPEGSGAGYRSTLSGDGHGDYAGSREAGGYNAQTGRGAVGRTTVEGDVQDGDREVDRQGAAVNTRTDSGVSWNDGDVYAGHDGNVYKHSADDGWQKYGSGGWQDVERSGGGRDELSSLETERQGRLLGDRRAEGVARAGGFERGGFRGGGRFRR